MRKVYIDCGWFNGRGWKLFQGTKEYSDGFEVFAFDPFANATNRKNFTFLKKAVWTNDGKLKMFSSSRRGGQANGIYPNPRANNQENMVDCIDFSQWLINTVSSDDYVVLKMDIEGAEKQVLEKMIKDKSIDLIDVIYLENHVQLDNDKEFALIVEGLKESMGDNYRSAIEWVFDKYKR